MPKTIKISGESEMTPEQIKLVQSSFEKVVPIADLAAELFYARLFEIDPSLRSMFHGDMKEQGRKLMSILHVAVSNLHRLDTIIPAVKALGVRHGSYGVEDEHYNTVAVALLWTLEKGLGEAFTPETREAWVEAYTALANVMKDAAAEAKARHEAEAEEVEAVA
jgi:hemoglobin-like flavoprotein